MSCVSRDQTIFSFSEIFALLSKILKNLKLKVGLRSGDAQTTENHLQLFDSVLEKPVKHGKQTQLQCDDSETDVVHNG